MISLSAPPRLRASRSYLSSCLSSAALGLLAVGCQAPDLTPAASGPGLPPDASRLSAPSGAPLVGPQRLQVRAPGRAATRPPRAVGGRPAPAGSVRGQAAAPFEGTTVAVVLTTNRVGEIEPCG